MLKRLAILALLCPLATVGILTCQDAVKGTPEQGVAKAGSSQSGQQQAETQDHSQNTQNSAPIHVEAAPPVDEPAQEEARQNLKIQGELALFTGLLVFVGFLQVGTMIWQAWLLRGTLKAIEVQAGHMGEQTTAANLSAQAAMGVAVPVLMLDEFSLMLSGNQSLKDDLQWPRMRISVKNFGQTPAFLRSFAVEFACNEHPAVLEYADARYFDPGTAVETGKSFSLAEAGVESLEGFSKEDAAGIAAGTKTLFIYGCIWYGDVFGPTVHELRFCKVGVEFGKAGGVLWIELDNPYAREDQYPN
jgi:hypothetical protein